MLLKKKFKWKSGLPRYLISYREENQRPSILWSYLERREGNQGGWKWKRTWGGRGGTLGRGWSQRLRPARCNKQRRLSHSDSRRLLLSRRANWVDFRLSESRVGVIYIQWSPKRTEFGNTVEEKFIPSLAWGRKQSSRGSILDLLRKYFLWQCVF